MGISLDISFTNSATTVYKTEVMASERQPFARLENGRDLGVAAKKVFISEATKNVTTNDVLVKFKR